LSSNYRTFEMTHQLVPSDCTMMPLTNPPPGGLRTYELPPSAVATPATLHVFGDCAVRLITYTFPVFADAAGSVMILLDAPPPGLAQNIV
jgi:hypothetical protein